ncbi:hypothetical protein MRX96_008021 [Rhipicephalus microplus]
MTRNNFPFRHGFHWPHRTPTEQHADAVVYVSVVFVVFATIVLLLLATTCRTVPSANKSLAAEEQCEASQPLPTVVHLKNSGVGVRMETFSESNIV